MAKMVKKVGPSDINITLQQIVSGWEEEKTKEMRDATKRIADECCDEVKENCKGSWSSKYKEGWKVDKEYDGKKETYRIHNATDYQLVHLLEYGHAIANQYGHYDGRTNKFPHVIPAEKSAKKKMQHKTKEIYG